MLQSEDIRVKRRTGRSSSVHVFTEEEQIPLRVGEGWFCGVAKSDLLWSLSHFQAGWILCLAEFLLKWCSFDGSKQNNANP